MSSTALLASATDTARQYFSTVVKGEKPTYDRKTFLSSMLSELAQEIEDEKEELGDVVFDNTQKDSDDESTGIMSNDEDDNEMSDNALDSLEEAVRAKEELGDFLDDSDDDYFRSAAGDATSVDNNDNAMSLDVEAPMASSYSMADVFTAMVRILYTDVLMMGKKWTGKTLRIPRGRETSDTHENQYWEHLATVTEQEEAEVSSSGHLIYSSKACADFAEVRDFFNGLVVDLEAAQANDAKLASLVQIVTGAVGWKTLRESRASTCLSIAYTGPETLDGEPYVCVVELEEVTEEYISNVWMLANLRMAASVHIFASYDALPDVSVLSREYSIGSFIREHESECRVIGERLLLDYEAAYVAVIGE